MKTIIFTLSPSCYGSVVKRNVNQITLISKDIAITVKTLRKIKLQTSLYSLQVYKTRTFPTHFFLGFFRVTFFEQMFREFSERLHSKVSLSKTWKASKDQTFACAPQTESLEKKLKSLKKGGNVGILLQ